MRRIIILGAKIGHHRYTYTQRPEKYQFSCWIRKHLYDTCFKVVGRENLVDLRVERGSKAEGVHALRLLFFVYAMEWFVQDYKWLFSLARQLIIVQLTQNSEAYILYTYSANKREAILASDRGTANSVKTNKSSHQFVKSSPFRTTSFVANTRFTQFS